MILRKIKYWSSDKTATVQSLLQRLLTVGYKAKGVQRSRTDTPNLAGWFLTFPNSDELKWSKKEMGMMFRLSMVNSGVKELSVYRDSNNRCRIYASISGNKTK